MGINELFGKYALGTIRPEDYITWAEQQLIAGIESASLSVLAGMDLVGPIDSIEVRDWFCRVIKELDIDWPQGDAALQRYSEILCRQILDGEIEPGNGLTQLARFYSASAYDERLYAIWDALEEDISLLDSEYGAVFNSGLISDNSDAYIRKVARQYLQLIKRQLPDNFFELHYCLDCRTIQPARRVRCDKPWLPEQLYRLIYRRGAACELRCANCHSRNLQSMNDFAGRERYLEQLKTL